MNRRWQGRRAYNRERRHLYAACLVTALCAGAIGAVVWGACQPHGIVARVLIALLS